MAGKQSTPEQQSVRVLKVGERVRHILSELLARGEAHDEVLTAHSVSVTEVRMTPDLRNAKAYVKPLLGEDEAADDDWVDMAVEMSELREQADAEDHEYGQYLAEMAPGDASLIDDHY